MIDIKVFDQFKQLDEHDEFYATMGEFFAFRSYAKEMGGWQFYNQDNSTWFLASIDGELVGFCSLFDENTHVFFDNFYILKEHRSKGYSRILNDSRLECAARMGKEIRCITDNELQMKNYERQGFIHYGDRGRYKKYKFNPGKEGI